MTEIVIATANPHKVRELRAILGELGISVVGLGELEARGEGPFAEPEETGDTFERNATIKALSYARQTGRVCLADDSGLEIDALDRRPGVISSHYCTDGVEKGMSRDERDRLNNERVMREMDGVAQRSGRFVCVMVLAGDPGSTGFQPVAIPRPPGSTAFQPVAIPRPPGSTAFQPVEQDTPIPNTNFQPTATSKEQGTRPPSNPERSPAAQRTFDGNFMASRRSLPHWQAGRATYFVTFRLSRGTLAEQERWVVLDAIRHFDAERYVLHAAVVMPDHAHMLFRVIAESDGGYPTLSSILHSIKSFTSNTIQRSRGVRGPLWQREYFDRIMRGQIEISEKLRYIAENPVRRGLCEKTGDYPFAYIYQREGDDSGAFRHRLEAGATSDRLRTRDGHRLEAGATSDRLRTRDGHRLEAGATSDRVGAGAVGACVLAIARGEFAGRIGLAGEVPRGKTGFGYDPLFLVGPGFERTSAEMEKHEKNAVSHRAKACASMADRISELLGGRQSEAT